MGGSESFFPAMTFTKTIGGLDPWSMPSDGTPYVSIDAETKRWERRQYHKALRREAKLSLQREQVNAND
jgi:hypothetical protein